MWSAEKRKKSPAKEEEGNEPINRISKTTTKKPLLSYEGRAWYSTLYGGKKAKENIYFCTETCELKLLLSGKQSVAERWKLYHLFVLMQ